MAGIHVDPDGTRWIGVDVSPEMFNVLQDAEKLAAVERAVSRLFWREYWERFDREIMEGFQP